MTGPEHYSRAEKHIDWAAETDGDGWMSGRARYHLAAAQVHATLALAAATATLDAAEGPGGGSATGRTVDDEREWAHALYGKAAA